MRLGGCGDGVIVRRRESWPSEGGLQALGLAIKNALEKRSTGAVAWRKRCQSDCGPRAGRERAWWFGGFEVAASDPVGGPG